MPVIATPAPGTSMATCFSFDDKDEDGLRCFDISDDVTAAAAPYSTIIFAARDDT